MRVPKSDQTKDQKAVLAGFQWKYTTPKPKVRWVPRNNNRKDDHCGGMDHDHSSYHGKRNDSHR